MTSETGMPAVHPAGEQRLVELAVAGPATAETFAGRVHLEWEPAAPVTTMGQLVSTPLEDDRRRQFDRAIRRLFHCN